MIYKKHVFVKLKRKRKIIFYFIGLFFLLLSSCDKIYYGQVEPYQKELFINAEYSYSESSSRPQLVIKSASTAIRFKNFELKSDELITGDIRNDRARIEISEIGCYDELGSFEVIETMADFDNDVSKKVVTEELRNGKYEQDVENFLQVTKASKLNVVLVLDVSSSLGEDVQLVKAYASDFINRIYQERYNLTGGSKTRFGIVGFSDKITARFTEDPAVAISFVNNLEGTDATKLYEAMDLGVSLANLFEADSRALITFTDGRNNSWSDQAKYGTQNTVLGNIKKSNIDSYTIGLKGKADIDEDVLEELAVRGFSQTANNASDLEKLFSKVSKSVAATYTLFYDRNDSRVNTPLQLRFKIPVQLF